MSGLASFKEETQMSEKLARLAEAQEALDRARGDAAALESLIDEAS